MPVRPHHAQATTRGDDAERDADAAAEQVLGMAASGDLLETAESPRTSLAAAGTGMPEGGGDTLPTSSRAFFEPRFNESLAHVRVHTGPEAAASARAQHARAYTFGSDIVFGANAYDPGSPRGDALLAHELAHVAQQTGSLGGAGPTRHVAAPQLARSVDDWLRGSVDVSRLEYTEVLAEIDELRQYIQRQTESTADSAQIEQGLALLRAEAARREAATGEHPAARAGRPGSRGRRGAPAPAPAAVASSAPLPDRYPRVLSEMTSVAYENPAEMRAEYNLIMQWLAREDISPGERRIMLAERDSLAPQLTHDRERVVTERHAARVRAALTPADENDAGALQDLARTIEGIAAEAGTPEIHYIYDHGERIAISRTQAEGLRASIRTELDRAARRTESSVTYYWERYNSQLALNRDSPIIAGIAGWLGNVEDPAEELSARYFWIMGRTRRMRELVAAGQTVEAAAIIPQVERASQEVRALARAFYEGHIDGAEIAVRRLEFTRDASFAIAGSIAAVVAAPVVAGFVGVGGLGATGMTAAVLTTGGTSAVVGTGMAVVRGGSAALGTGAAGGSWSEIGNAFTSEGLRGLREGALSGAGAGAARVLGPMLGVGADVGYQALRRVAAEALVNGTTTMVDVLTRGGSLPDAVAAGGRAALLSVPGALVGGIDSPIARYFVAPLTAGGTAYLGARAEGMEPDQALAQAGVAVAANVAMSSAAHGSDADAALVERGRSMGASTRGAVRDASRSVASVTASVMIGTADALPPLRSGFGSSPVVSLDSPSIGSGTGSTTVRAPPAVETTAPPPVAPHVSTTETPPPVVASAVDATPPVSAAATPHVETHVGTTETPAPVVASTADATPATTAAVDSTPPVATAATPHVEADATPATPATAMTDATSPATTTHPASAVDDLNVDAAFSESASYNRGEMTEISRTGPSRSSSIRSLGGIVLSAAQRLAARALHGQRFGAALAGAWNGARNAREIADMATINNHIAAGRMTEARVLAREAFDRHRGRFWRAVRRDASLRAVFEDAGMVFPPGNGAPVYRDPVTGDILDRMTLEHSTRLADDPLRALDAGNLQTVLGDENSYALEALRREDPHQ